MNSFLLRDYFGMRSCDSFVRQNKGFGSDDIVPRSAALSRNGIAAVMVHAYPRFDGNLTIFFIDPLYQRAIREPAFSTLPSGIPAHRRHDEFPSHAVPRRDWSDVRRPHRAASCSGMAAVGTEPSALGC